MIRRKFLLLILVSMGVSLQSQTVLELPLDTCRARSLRHQAQLISAQLGVSAAQEQRAAAFTKYFPQLSATAGYFQSQDYMLNVSTGELSESGAQLDVNGHIQGTPIGGTVPSLDELLRYLNVDIDASLKMLDHGAFANAMLLQPVYAGGRIRNGNHLAQLGVDAAQLKLVIAEDEVLFAVEQHYWLLWTLQSKRRTLQQALLMVDTLQRDAEAATSAGVIGRNDLLKVKLQHQELLAAQTQLSNGITLATMALLQYVGMPFEEVPELKLDSPEEVPVALSLEGTAFSPYGRPEAQLLELDVKAHDLQRRMALGEALPQIGVGATYGYNNILGSSFTGNGLLFATAQVPLSAWWETIHNHRKMKYEQLQSEINRTDLMEKLRLQNQQIYFEMVEAYQLMLNRQQAVSDATENLAEVKNYYEAGMSSVSDYLEAQTLLQQAQTDLADHQMVYMIKQLRWRQVSPQM